MDVEQNDNKSNKLYSPMEQNKLIKSSPPSDIIRDGTKVAIILPKRSIKRKTIVFSCFLIIVLMVVAATIGAILGNKKPKKPISSVPATVINLRKPCSTLSANINIFYQRDNSSPVGDSFILTSLSLDYPVIEPFKETDRICYYGWDKTSSKDASLGINFKFVVFDSSNIGSSYAPIKRTLPKTPPGDDTPDSDFVFRLRFQYKNTNNHIISIMWDFCHAPTNVFTNNFTKAKKQPPGINYVDYWGKSQEATTIKIYQFSGGFDVQGYNDDGWAGGLISFSYDNT